jgi:hypothetical protein
VIPSDIQIQMGTEASYAMELLTSVLPPDACIMLASREMIVTRSRQGCWDIDRDAQPANGVNAKWDCTLLHGDGLTARKQIYSKFGNTASEAARALCLEWSRNQTVRDGAIERAMCAATDTGVFDRLIDDAERYELATL